MKIAVTAALAGLVFISGVFAQYNPPTGGEDVYQFYSPLFLARGASVTSAETPEADAINPAVSGANQRPALDLSYIGLSGFDAAGGNGWLGHAANIGASFPTRAGVLTGSAHFLSSFLPGMTLGNNIGLRFSFAKELYPDLLVGAGLNLDAGGYNTTDFGVGLSLGALVLPGDVGPLKNFRWGVVLQNLGKWYTPVAGRSPVPPPFTPALGVGFDLVDNQTVRIGLSGDLSFPTFQNVRFNAGGTLSLWDTVAFNVGWNADLRNLLNGTQPQSSLLPSFGISVTFKTDLKQKSGFIAEQGWNRSEVRTRMSAAPLYGNVWGIGGGINASLGIVDRTPPEIGVDYPSEVAISPNNDGRKDALEVPISITDSRYVSGYSLQIEDASGRVVRTIANKENRPENSGFQSVIDRLAAVKSGIPIPKSLRWDGTADDGSIVPDGTYRFSLEAWDDNGNRGRSPWYTVVVDNTSPAVEVSAGPADNLIFSPNGDGNKDTLAITQSGSVETLWTGEIIGSDGRVVLHRSWKGEAPGSFVWDGRGDDGTTVPDGVYRYEVKSTDAAGNSGNAQLSNIIVNTAATPVELSIDRAYFSPNGDNVDDNVTLTLKIPAEREVSSWRLEVSAAGTGSSEPGAGASAGAEAAAAVRTYQGTEGPPSAVRFDGRDESGAVLPEGAYRATLSVQYRNGNAPKATSPVFRLDNTAPSASVTASDTVFSPNGDGSKDTITFYQETSREESWQATVKDASGKRVKSFSFRGTAEPQLSWDGRDDQGKLVADGVYTYALEATDRAGNVGRSNTVEFRVDTEATPVILAAEYDAFSPNADGVKDSIALTPTLRRNDGIDRYSYTVEAVGADGKPAREVRSVQGRSRIDGPFVWDGRDDAGRLVPDGSYRGRLDVIYANGNHEEAATAPFVVDTSFPLASVSFDHAPFSPDGDGRRDTIRISQSSSDETLWQGRILSSSGAEVRTYYWKGRLADFVWDGTDDAGNRVADGSYRYQVSAEDAAGNRTERTLEGIVVDTRPAAVFVTAADAGFSPNGDKVRDSETFTMYTNLLDGITGWKLDIERVPESGGKAQVVREFTGKSADAQFSLSWNGREGSDDGPVAPDGRYRARFEVTYAKGNLPHAETPAFVLDTTPPAVDLSIHPKPFSPDNDGVDDELHIGISVNDASEIGSWKLMILDRNDNYFTDFSGRGRPAKELIWDGRSKDGELVISAEDYPYVFSITDVLGNSTVVRGVIPVDILVIREGDQLKVRISSITFTPDSPELILDPSTLRGVRNNEILTRLAEIFAKYSSYRIRIEGHAVNISGTEREQQQELIPLSRARAQAVKDALVARGISADRITVAGLGDENPVVPDSDIQNRWKNRRVEFILIK